jgi:hypothetical protein
VQQYALERKLHYQNIKYFLHDTLPHCSATLDSPLESFAKETRVTDAHAVLVLYAIDDRASFLVATKMLEKLKRQAAPLQVVDGKTVLTQTSFVEHQKLAEKQYCLVACKSDLSPINRHVTYREGMALAKKHGVGFMETSSKNGTNVEKLFASLTELFFLSKT